MRIEHDIFDNLNLGPDTPTMVGREENALVVAFEPISDPLRHFTIKARCTESSSTELSTDFDCDEASQMCEIGDLEPAIQYSVQLVSCFKINGGEDICSEPSASVVEWTMPSGLFLFLQHKRYVSYQNSYNSFLSCSAQWIDGRSCIFIKHYSYCYFSCGGQRNQIF